MTKKRKSLAVEGNDRKFRSAQQSGYEIKAPTDPTTGQQSAFPGLEGTQNDSGNSESDGLFYGPAEDGLAYLKMVRAEAAGVPSMLLAPKQSDLSRSPQSLSTQNTSQRIPKSSLGISAFWAGEAVVADPTSEEDYEYDGYGSGDGEEEDYGQSSDPQEVCYNSLVERFLSLRSSLEQAANDPKSGDYSHIERSGLDPSLAVSLTTSQNMWYRTFSYCKPTTALLASLSHSSIMLAFERLNIILTKRNLMNSVRRANLGVWIWSLLARCREQGQLTGEELAVLRLLAKSALNIERKLRAHNVPPATSRYAFAASQDDEDEDDDMLSQNGDDLVNEATAGKEAKHADIEDGEIEDSEQDLAAARQKLLGLLQSDTGEVEPREVSDADEQLLPVFMMLDSIVTIVGSVFGQRDLLDQRKAW